MVARPPSLENLVVLLCIILYYKILYYIKQLSFDPVVRHNTNLNLHSMAIVAVIVVIHSLILACKY